MKMKIFISYVLTEIPKFKGFFSYVKDYEYRKFFKNQVSLYFEPMTNIYKNGLLVNQEEVIYSDNSEKILETPQVTFEVISSLLVLRIKTYGFNQNKKSFIEKNSYIENSITHFLPLVNQELLLNRMRRAVA